MPFHRWLPESNEYNSEKWLKSIKDHEKWINDRLDELNCPVIVGTRPAMRYDTLRLFLKFNFPL